MYAIVSRSNSVQAPSGKRARSASYYTPPVGVTPRIYRRPKYAYVSAKSTKASKGVTALIKKSIVRMAEPKRVTFEVAHSLESSIGASWNTNNTLQLTPSSSLGADYTITQGTGQAQRVGNSIRVKKATVRLAMYPQAYSGVSNPVPKPIDVRLLVVAVKPGVTTGAVTKAQIQTIVTTNVFANSSTSTSAVNNLYDMITPINTDVLTVYMDEVVKLGPAAITGTGASTTVPQSNNDYKLNHLLKMDITKYLPSKITFNDADGSSTSRQIFLIMLACNFDGTVFPTTTFPASWFGGLDLDFIDM